MMPVSIQFFCPRWGSEHFSWEEFCMNVKSEGYNGIEYAIPYTATTKELDAAWNAAARHGLLMLPQHFDTYTADFSAHYDAYCAWLQRIKAYKPFKVNSQTGKDFFSFEQNRQLIDAAAASGVPVVHETHRNKFSYAAHVTQVYLEKIPHLQLTLDASHWVCVAESYLDDQPVAMQMAIERTAHIHARVGYPEGPQVPDPRAAEWQEALEKHLHWWDKVVQRIALQSPGAALTISPEFGPFPYMVHLPGTGRAVTDQWEVNSYMMHLLRTRYSLDNESVSKAHMAPPTL